ncbi:MAG: lipocalin family protein [Marinirhabdus sp.]
MAALIVIGCAKTDPREQQRKLAGYWEIKTVQLPDRAQKEYNISTTIDYIEVTENRGTRKKVRPNIEGTFHGTPLVENFDIKIEADSLILYYETPFYSWKETVIKAEDSLLVIKNKDGKIYRYKKFRPVTLGGG